MTKDWIKHISRIDVPNKGKTWCDRRVDDWAFVSIDHATLTREQRQRLIPCKKCVAKIIKELTNEE